MPNFVWIAVEREREEEQVEHERFDALFMNLWDVRRTLGLGSLFFR
ncbi:MAG: hypothetical protein HIU83_00220 [Proteobacteria bacterium]|nr:hypothetical protein [Pseudomonadota bacterium]